MLKPNQIITIKWATNNKAYYESLGYKYTKVGQELQINAEDLMPSSHQKIVAICDFCGKEFEVTKTNYTRSTKDGKPIACKECKNRKTRKTLQAKYGINCPFQKEEFKEKARNTLMNSYGVANPMQLRENREKMQQTMIDKYGVAHALQLPEFQEKAISTTQKHYGVDYYIQSVEGRKRIENTMNERYGNKNPGLVLELVEKAKKTCTERYGGESSQCDSEIRQKSWETLRMNHGLPSSQKEQQLVLMLKKLYGEDSCFPQYMYEKLLFDCLLIVEGVYIDVEYDGWYWHKNAKEKDKKRDFFVMRRGFKVLRYQSNGELPTAEQILANVQYLVNSEHKHLIVKMNDIQDEDIV